jgi:Fur family peroxide stress response transcriptional regulator
MENKQKRMTKQKAVVYEVLCSTTSHPTADWIYAESRKRIPDISLGTVYRNLQALVKEGRILELNYGKAQSRFDGNPAPHYHFVCLDCGRVYDFAFEGARVAEEVFAGVPGRVDSYRLECYGACHDCLA